MRPERMALCRKMLRSPRLEEAAERLWDEVKISAETHLSTGDEWIVPVVVDHLREDDAMALDYRGTALLVIWGVV